MNTTKRHLFSVLILSVSFAFSAYSQPQESPEFSSVTAIHLNQDLQDFSIDAWKTVEKEYFDKFTNKNEFIVTSIVLTHFFTADNIEIDKPRPPRPCPPPFNCLSSPIILLTIPAYQEI